LFNPNYDPTRKQKVVCDRCGNEIPLDRVDETEWSIYSVICEYCGGFALVSKYRIELGSRCPRCKTHKLQVPNRFPNTKQMRDLIKGQQVELWQFKGDGEVVKVD
jgi:hypothetical protein